MAKTHGCTESDELSPRERAFVEQYLLSANGAKAANAAGYARKSAKVRARRLLRRPRLWDKPGMLRLAGRHVGVAGFVERLELTGKDGNAIELQRRVDAMTDDELKARVAELIAKL
jgi:hypothetical protein